MRITLVAGARPNFMKIAPLIHELEKQRKHGKQISFRLIHTGQHYDKNLSDTFFKELNIPEPHQNLEVKSGTQAEQTAAIMIGFEKELNAHPADLVLVVGDVTSTMACTIVAKKLHIKVAHIEAGIRSGDIKMPEEINRIVTDSITDYFFTTTSLASEYLKKTGTIAQNVFFVGNVMIDTLINNLPFIKKPSFWDEFKLIEKNYYVLTLHRPSNVDSIPEIISLLKNIIDKTKGSPIIFPVHPRTQKIIKESKISFPNLFLVSPQGYMSFIYLIKYAKAVLTDSGGITEEASYLNVPCITFRDNTERPETITLGTNILVGNDNEKLEEAFKTLDANKWKQSQPIPLWDGKAAERIIDIILKLNAKE